MAGNSRLLVGAGARAVEAALLGDLLALLGPPRPPTVAELAAPVRVVVPSRALRTHLAARLLERRGGAIAGITISSLYGLGLEILARAGEPPPRGSALFPVLVERFAATEPALADPLGPLRDGFAPVVAAVQDLLDAGFDPALLDAAEEMLASDGAALASREALARARSLLRVAAATRSVQAVTGIARPADALRRASRLLAEAPDEVLPARAVFVHGFADATGAAADLLEALLRHHETRIYLGEPPDPAAGAGDAGDAGEASQHAFSRRLRERLRGAAHAEERIAAGEHGGEGPALDFIAAVDPEAEVVAVADRLATLIAEGRAPERLAVVCRELGALPRRVSYVFDELGIPFSLPEKASSTARPSHRAAAVLELVRRRGQTATEHWLEVLELPAAQEDPGRNQRLELRLACHLLGAGRLGELAGLDLDSLRRRGGLRLPAQAEVEEEGERGGADQAGARRFLPAKRLEELVRLARRSLARLEAWPANAPLDRHFDELAKLLGRDLGWSSGSGEREIEQAIERARQDLPAGLGARLELGAEEFQRLLQKVLAEVGHVPLGHESGGVQVLSVTAARGLTFDHLFVVGLNRDAFPRPVREDPLLADDLRGLLGRLLPDVPVKRRGFAEERHLFAQLLSASPAITLSWAACDEAGRPLTRSPLLERLRWARPEGSEPAPALPIWARASGVRAPGLRPAAVRAMQAGLAGERERFRALLPRVLAVDDPVAAVERAAFLAAVLDEIDPDLTTAEGRRTSRRLGPYLGLVGRGGAASHGPLPITRLENLAACAWQTHLARNLRLEALPDPLATLPELAAQQVGTLVHRALERLARLAGLPARGELAEVLARAPVRVPWPAPAALRRELEDLAAELLAESGPTWPGLARALAARALPHLEAARELLWAEGDCEVLGVEVEGSCTLGRADAPAVELHFRADLVARGARLVLCDYKTGRPLSSAKTEKSRREHLLNAVASGERLQAAAYQVGAAALGEAAEGWYLFLRPELERDLRVFSTAGDAELAATFSRAAETALAGWEAGVLFPRLVEPRGEKEPARCAYCPVAEACLRHDSGSRLRLLRTAQTLAETQGSESALTPTETVFLASWRLADTGGVDRA